MREKLTMAIHLLPQTFKKKSICKTIHTKSLLKLWQKTSDSTKGKKAST